MNDSDGAAEPLLQKAADLGQPRPDAITRGWLSDLLKSSRDDIRVTKRRITSYEVWERVLAKVTAGELITDDGQEVKLSSDVEAQVREAAQKMAEAAVHASNVGLAVRL